MKNYLAFTCLSWLLVAEAQAASYTVPSGEFLPVPVTVPLQDARLWQDSRFTYMFYSLPKELDGAKPQTVFLAGKATGSTFTLKSDDAAADCVVQNEETNCTVRYDDLRLNHEAAEDFLATQVLEDARRLELRNAREELEHQAVGIVTFRPNSVLSPRDWPRRLRSRAHLRPW